MRQVEEFMDGQVEAGVPQRSRSRDWSSAKARHVLASLRRIGWAIKRSNGSHRVLARQGRPDVVFAFHDGEEIGRRMLVRIARTTGLTPDDL